MSKIKTNKINIAVNIDTENNQIQDIFWEADDNPAGNTKQESKAMLLSFFDPKTLETLKIDLWTSKMQVMEMDRMVFQTMRSLADSYFKATKNDKMASAMQQFAMYFGEETGIIPKEQ